ALSLRSFQKPEELRQGSSTRRKGRIPVDLIRSSRGRRLAWSRGFTPPRGYQSPVMDGDPGALVTPRRSGPEVVGSNPTGPTKRPATTALFCVRVNPFDISFNLDYRFRWALTRKSIS